MRRVVIFPATKSLCLAWLALLCPFLLLSGQVVSGQYPVPPQTMFKDLFAAVEMERGFPASKEFADAVPRSAPPDILALYHSEKPRQHPELQRFVGAHFQLHADVT